MTDKPYAPRPGESFEEHVDRVVASLRPPPEQQVADEWLQELAELIARSIWRDAPPLTPAEQERKRWLKIVLGADPDRV